MDQPCQSPANETPSLPPYANQGALGQDSVDVDLGLGLTRSPTPGLFASSSYLGQSSGSDHGGLFSRHPVFPEHATSMASRMRQRSTPELGSMGNLDHRHNTDFENDQIQASAQPGVPSTDLSHMDFNLGSSFELHPAFQDMTASTDVDLGGFDALSSKEESDSAACREVSIDSNMAVGMSLAAPSDSSVGSVDSIVSSASRRSRRRRRRNIGSQHRVDAHQSERKYQCTFCTDRFKTKYDWQRHEASVHLSLEQWQCAKFGPVAQESDGSTVCVFCGELSPDLDHHSSHNYSQCLARPVEERVFRRKDHLRQHLRIVHNGSSFIKKMEDWFASIENVNSRCGFCGTTMAHWVERQKHLARHFKEGADMKDWDGDRGFDEEIDRLVENDIPVFMIGHQRETMEPFSASQASHYMDVTDPEFGKFIGGMTVQGQDASNEASSSFQAPQALPFPHAYRHVESVLLALVKYELGNGRVPTDDQLKKKTSEIMFGPDNDWDQTWADNPQWLASFKKKAGLISLPDTDGRNAFIGLDDT